MSTKQKKSRHPNRPTPPSPATQKPEPAGQPVPCHNPAAPGKNSPLVDLSDLTFRQQAALPVIALSPSIAQAARLSGIGESTLRRWLADPAFRSQIDQVRQEAAHSAAQELQRLMPLCASVFADAMQSSDPALRLRAARYTLSFILRISEMEKLSNDLSDLQTAASLSNTARP